MPTELQIKFKEWVKKEQEKYSYMFLVASLIHFKFKHATSRENSLSFQKKCLHVFPKNKWVSPISSQHDTEDELHIVPKQYLLKL